MTETIPQPSPELAAVYERVTKGMAWLTENDEHGAFHLWFTSGILPHMPMPAQGDDVKERYGRYYKNRTVWERLWREMENRERAEGLLT